ncbi:MAG: helix-turn-helix domain-containing protein [Clostridia bacterium]|nr:helix-turn-helix domain-containing protein [Clostridia bacterium]MDE6605306.1 helix-turn-helix domain-containing protein [Clostridia bacterium]
MITLNQIQTNLAMAIKYSGMTHLQIAKLVGVSKSCISHYIKGDRMPTLDVFANLCKILDESADYILGLE